MDIRAPLRPSKSLYTIDVVESRSGRPVPVVNGKTLHSRYDPEAEARRWVQEKLALKPNAQVAVILGMGFAYHIRALREALPAGAPIVVFEPVTELVTTYAAKVKQSIDNVRLWPNPRPQDVVDAVAEVLTPTRINDILIAGHPPSVELDPASYQTILAQIHATVDQIAMSLTTGWGFGFEWIENALRNAPRLPDLPFLNQIAPALRAAPPAALVIGAGPSLDNSWEIVQRAEVLKLADDTALEPMQTHGVVPHLAFLLDSQYENSRLVERIDAGAQNLAVSLDVHPSVFESRWRNLLVASCAQGLLSWLERRGQFQAGSLKQGGSVATSAFDLARQAGCSPIYFTGIDLSFSAHRIYCRGVAYERRAAEPQSRCEPVEHKMYRMKQERTERVVSGRATQDNLYNYYRWFKDEIGRTAQPTVLLHSTGLLAEFLPTDGATRMPAERFPTGFDERMFHSKLPVNGRVTNPWIREALSDFRRNLEKFLAPGNFSSADQLDEALAASDIRDVTEAVVQPVVAVSRYGGEQGGLERTILTELRDRLGGLVRVP